MSFRNPLDENLYGTHLVIRPSYVLSRRQAQVLHYASEGLSLVEIARELGLSPKTVEVHSRFLRSHLGAVDTLAEAVARAVYLGLAVPAHQAEEEEGRWTR